MPACRHPSSHDAAEAAIARLYGEPLLRLPNDLYIPPDALEIFLDAFEGPLDLLLYLIRKQNFNILDIPMAQVTLQYLAYVEQIRKTNLELAAEYLLMAAMLIEIKSRMLLPKRQDELVEDAGDPRAELVRRLLEYEQIKLAAQQVGPCPSSTATSSARRCRSNRAGAGLAARRSARPAARLDGRAAPRQADPASPDRPRGTVGARAHVGDPAYTAIEPLHRILGTVPWPGQRAGRGRALRGHARAGQGNPDRNYPGRTIRAHLRPAGLFAGLSFTKTP
jgi:hypothetical protein